MSKLFNYYGRFKSSTEPGTCPQGVISSVGWEPFRHLRQVSWGSKMLLDLPLKYCRSRERFS